MILDRDGKSGHDRKNPRIKALRFISSPLYQVRSKISLPHSNSVGKSKGRSVGKRGFRGVLDRLYIVYQKMVDMSQFLVYNDFMLKGIFGNNTAEKVLLHIYHYGESHASAIAD